MKVKKDSGKGGYIRLIGSRTNLILAILALIILIGSLTALVHHAMRTYPTDELIVNGKAYDWGSLKRDFTTIEQDGRTGISLEELLIDSGVDDIGSRSFRFIGADGYQKEIPGTDIVNGMINTQDRMVILPALAKQTWVRDLVRIEVI